MSQWQPIETAPKDGRAIWLWSDGEAFLGYCEPANHLWRHNDTWTLKASWTQRESDMPDEIYGCNVTDAKPTHWMPLPDAPTQ